MRREDRPTPPWEAEHKTRWEGKEVLEPERPARPMRMRVTVTRTASRVRMSLREKGVIQKRDVIFGFNTDWRIDSADKGGTWAMMRREAMRLMLIIRSVR